MDSAGLLVDAFGRIRDVTHAAVDGLDGTGLMYRPTPQANSIAWLVWHLTRIQDDHVAAAAGTEQVWARSWAQQFGLSLPVTDTGYAHSAQDVAKVVVESGDQLLGYHDAVHRATVDYVGALTDADLDRVVDERWDPPVTLAVRLISVIADDLQHAGQAAFLRGLLPRT